MRGRTAPKHKLARRMHTGSSVALEAGGAMAEHAEVWNLHLVYQLSPLPPGFEEDVLRRVRAIAAVTSVAVVPSSDAATHLAFSTRSAHGWSRPSRPNTASKRPSTRTTPPCGGNGQ
jgi:hypothetical protein